MKQRLLAIAAFLAAAGAGVYFVNYSDGTLAPLADAFGALEVVDRSQCSTSNCGAAACTQANNILADAGSACTTKLVECPVRIGQRAKNLAADAGVPLALRSDGGIATYQNLRLIALKCGTASFGVPVDDAGWPVFAVASIAHPCAWKPRDAGAATCVKGDGGNPGFENTLQPGDFSGSGCQPKACVEVAGTSSVP